MVGKSIRRTYSHTCIDETHAGECVVVWREEEKKRRNGAVLLVIIIIIIIIIPAGPLQLDISPENKDNTNHSVLDYCL